MSKVKILDDIQKQCVYNGFLTGGSKSQLANQFNVSARTIGRVIEEKLNESGRKKGLHSKPFPKPKFNSSPKMIGSESFITVINEGVVYTVDSSHSQFKNALEAVKVGDIQKVLTLINTKEALKTYSKGDIKIIGHQVLYKDVVFDTGITKRIIREMHNDRPYEHLVAFFERLMQNPSRDAIYQLYGFLVHNDIEITDDGYILAWKRVNINYTDLYTGTIDNSPGKVVSVPRNTVDENKNRTCSHGLHVAAKSYLPHYGGGRGVIIQCKIDPADVVAIPTDYDNAKMRVCRYTVLKDVTRGFSHYS